MPTAKTTPAAADPRGDELLAEVRPYVLAAAARLSGRGVPADDLRQEGLLRALELCRLDSTFAHPNPPALVVQSAQYAMADLLGDTRDQPPLATDAALESLASPPPAARPGALPDEGGVAFLMSICKGATRLDCEVAARRYAGGAGIRVLSEEFGLSHRAVRQCLYRVGLGIAETLASLKLYRAP